MKTGVYKITSPSNKVYIGEAIDIEFSWNRRYKYATCPGQPKLYNSLKKYGWDAHKKEVLEEIHHENKEELIKLLLKRETYYKQLELDKVGGDWSKVLFCDLHDNGGPRSEATKKKMSESGKKRISKLRKKRKGKSLFKNNKLRCKKISENNLGKSKHTEERKQIISQKLKGNKNRVGHKMSKKSCKQISEAKKGHSMFNDEWRSKISKSMKGRPLSEEHKKALTGIKRPKGTGAKIAAAIKGKRDIPVLQKDLNGNILKEWPSGKEAGRVLGIQRSNINNACKGRMKTYKGFIWEQRPKT